MTVLPKLTVPTSASLPSCNICACCGVTSVASLVASTAGHEHAAVTIVWFPAVDWFSFADTHRPSSHWSCGLSRVFADAEILR